MRPDGYGKIVIPGTKRQTTVHRAAAFAWGRIESLDSKKVVAPAATCAQGCFNPAHVTVYQDRASFARELGYKPRGQKNPRHKLPQALAEEALRLCHAGQLTDEDIAAELNRRLGRPAVSTRMVMLLRTKKTWRHLWLPAPPSPLPS